MRRAVHAVYQTYEVDLEALRRSAEDGDVTTSATELVRLGGRAARMFGDLRLAQVKALAEAGMSEEEYYAIQAAVYVAAGAWQTSREPPARCPPRPWPTTARRVREAMKTGIEAARERACRAASGSPRPMSSGSRRPSPRWRRPGAEALTVPPANVELFRKHEDAIRKYAMHGLALLGL